MELLKMILVITLISFFGTQVRAQDANFTKQSEAFKLSYQKEKAKDYTFAVQTLLKIYDENSYEINLRLGWLYYLNNELENSIKFYNKAIELKPFAIEPKFGLTYPVYATANTSHLIKIYNQILSVAPNNSIALYKLGSVYFYQKQYEKAEKYFTKVVDLFPFNYDSLIMLAHTNFHLKKIREATVLYHKVLLYNPDDKEALAALKLLK